MISFASEHRRDRENREKRRDKESHPQEVEQHHQEWQESKDYFHGIKDGDREKAREREERDRRREKGTRRLQTPRGVTESGNTKIHQAMT